MALSLDAFRIKHKMNLNSPLKEFCESKRDLHNGTFYILFIKNTIHYNALKVGNFYLYDKYIKETNQLEHSVEKFKSLLEHWDITKFGKLKVRVQAHSTFFWVFDGAHRLSILYYKQYFGNTIPIELCDVEFFSCVINKLKDSLRKTTQITHYNGWNNRTEFGYHSFNLFNISIPGQRNPLKRFERIKLHYSFKDKKVLDLGCNTGGMLVHIPEIQHGIGIDYDSNCIDFCNLLSSYLNYSCKLEFHVGDLNNFSVKSFCSTRNFQPDIVFLFSLGSWIKEWKKLYSDAFNLAKHILLETNNDTEGKEQLYFFISLGASVQCISFSSDDDSTGNIHRKTYLICNTKL